MKIFKKIKDFFVPHSGNDYQPPSLQKAAVLGMMLLVVISFTVANLQALLWISSDWMVSTILPAVIVTETNDERQDEKLRPLVRNRTLEEAAQRKAEDMAKYSYFAHNSPKGLTPWYWFEEVDYNYVHAGENLAVHFTDSGEVVEAWMDSPTHRANILNGDFQEIGIGTAKGEYEGFATVFVVQLFGTKAATPRRTVSVAETITVPVEVAQIEAVPTITNTPVVLAETDTVTPASLSEAPKVAGVEENVPSAEAELIAIATTSSTTVPILAAVAESETTKEVTVTEAGTVVYSSYVSTTTGGTPASIEVLSSHSVGGTTSAILSVATKPHLVLQLAYIIIGGFVLLALLISILIEIRRQHPAQIAYGLGLVTLMILLFNLHLTLSQGVLIM